jgi:hypothetical protein
MKSGRTPKTISVEESVKKLTKPIANTLHNPADLFWSSSSLKLLSFFVVKRLFLLSFFVVKRLFLFSFSFISAVFHSTLLWL